MNKIEYIFDGEDRCEYQKEHDAWLGNLTEEDYVIIAQNITKKCVYDSVLYDYAPFSIELIINNKSVGLFKVGLEFEPKYTAKKIIKD